MLSTALTTFVIICGTIIHNSPVPGNPTQSSDIWGYQIHVVHTHTGKMPTHTNLLKNEIILNNHTLFSGPGHQQAKPPGQAGPPLKKRGMYITAKRPT